MNSEFEKRLVVAFMRAAFGTVVHAVLAASSKHGTSLEGNKKDALAIVDTHFEDVIKHIEING